MPDTILVPTDGSTESERALDIAIPLAVALDADITLLWAWDGLGAMDGIITPDVLANISDRETADRNTFLEDLAARHCRPVGVAYRCEVPIERPVQAILDATEPVNVRYVIMATHGRSGFKRWRLGSVADKIARTVDKPVVLFRPDEAISLRDTIQRILVPLDGSLSSEAALPHAIAIARASGASLHLLRVVSAIVTATPVGLDAVYSQANDAALEAAVADLDKLAQELTDPGHGPADGLDVTTAVFMGGPSTAILERASDTDLIVMASHGRGGVTRFALGSITDAVIRGSGKPVMVVPRRES